MLLFTLKYKSLKDDSMYIVVLCRLGIMCRRNVASRDGRGLDAIDFCSQHGQSCFSLLLTRTIQVTRRGRQEANVRGRLPDWSCNRCLSGEPDSNNPRRWTHWLRIVQPCRTPHSIICDACCFQRVFLRSFDYQKKITI